MRLPRSSHPIDIQLNRLVLAAVAQSTTLNVDALLREYDGWPTREAFNRHMKERFGVSLTAFKRLFAGRKQYTIEDIVSETHSVGRNEPGYKFIEYPTLDRIAAIRIMNCTELGIECTALGGLYGRLLTLSPKNNTDVILVLGGDFSMYRLVVTYTDEAGLSFSVLNHNTGKPVPDDVYLSLTCQIEILKRHRVMTYYGNSNRDVFTHHHVKTIPRATSARFGP